LALAVLGVAIAGLAQAQNALAAVGAWSVVSSVVIDSIPVSLTASPGDPARGRAIVMNRQVGLCLLCHSGPFPEERFQGDLAPDLKGAGGRLSEAELRLRMVDSAG
jgi:sulfur-oxidizing protein SoxX